MIHSNPREWDHAIARRRRLVRMRSIEPKASHLLGRGEPTRAINVVVVTQPLLHLDRDVLRLKSLAPSFVLSPIHRSVVSNSPWLFEPP